MLEVWNVSFAQTTPSFAEASGDLMQPAGPGGQSVLCSQPSAPAIFPSRPFSRSIGAQFTPAHNNMFASIVGEPAVTKAERIHDTTQQFGSAQHSNAVFPSQNQNGSVSQPEFTNLTLSVFDTKCVSKMLHGLNKCSGGDELKLVEFLTQVRQIFSITCL